MTSLVERVRTGNAILFCGAGFSLGSKNIRGESPKTASQLSARICEIGGFSVDPDLRFTSDFFIKRFPDKIPLLLRELRELFTVNEVSESMTNICSHRWRRIYTTNYDNSIEFASNRSGKYRESIFVDDDPSLKYKERNNVVHINGSIATLSDSTLNTSFKLTRSSYVSPTGFENSNWYYSFKKDLEQASAIVFVGYSMYDIEVEKILFNSNFKSKTFFINRTTEDQKTLFTLGEYGEVLTVGVDGLGTALGLGAAPSATTVAGLTEYLYRYELKEADVQISDSEIGRFIDHGVLDSKYIDQFVSGGSKRPFLVSRPKLETVVERANGRRHTVLFGDFGNGKSVLLALVRSSLTLAGKKVYSPGDYEGDYAKDIDTLEGEKETYIVVIDGYSKFKDLLDYIFHFNSKYCILILADRTNNHQRFRDFLASHVEFLEYNVDLLSTPAELKAMNGVISNLGYWGSRVAWSEDKKIDYIRNNCGSQISNVLMDVFDSPQMNDRLEAIVRPLCENHAFKVTIFAICVLEIMDLPLKESLISQVANNDSIYNPILTSSGNFMSLFSLDRGRIAAKSSIFSYILVKNHFEPAFVSGQMLEIVARFQTFKDSSREESVIFKSLLRFSFVEKILPDTNKRTNLVLYYQSLKDKISWLERDVHYWLQYGMAEITFKNYPTAQRYFDIAYEVARTKPNYNTAYIDTQQARLHLIKGLLETDGNTIYDYFSKAHDLLFRRFNDHYKFRQILLYGEYFDKKFAQLSPKRKSDFLAACRELKRQIETDQTTLFSIETDDYIKQQCIHNLSRIVTSGGGTAS